MVQKNNPMTDRISEKTFELRFCSALSSAFMPFNRNPQWFGLTQGEENDLGLDAILKLGPGRILFFQFKVFGRNQRIKFCRLQHNNILKISRLLNVCINYVFPDFRCITAASSIGCILSHSLFCPVHNLTPAFRSHYQSVSLSLKSYHNVSILTNQFNVNGYPVESCCTRLGCFCKPAITSTINNYRNHPLFTLLLQDSPYIMASNDQVIFSKMFEKITPISFRHVVLKKDLDDDINVLKTFSEVIGHGSIPGFYGFYIPD